MLSLLNGLLTKDTKFGRRVKQIVQGVIQSWFLHFHYLCAKVVCDSSKTNIPKTTILSDEPKHFLYKRLSYLPHILGQTCHLQFSGNFSSPLLLQFLSHVKSVKSAKLGESLKQIYLTFQLSTGYLE